MNPMNPISPDAALQAWKRQLDTGFRVIEALTESAERVRRAQLEAATSAHADAVATQSAVAKTGDAAQLLRLQAEWARGNAERAAAYWRAMVENAAQTGAELVACLGQTNLKDGKQ